MTASTEQVFQECVRDAMTQAQQLIHQVVANVIETFEARSNEALTSKERQRYHDLLTELRRAQRALAQNFIEQFNQLVQQGGAAQRTAQPAPLSFEELTLVEDDRVDEDVEVSQLIQQIEAGAEWEIRDLNARMSALRGNGDVDARHNPLRPEVFGRSLQRAVQAMPVGGEERLVLLRSFGNALSGALKDTYASYNQRLKARNIQPASYGYRTTRGPGAPLFATPSAASAAMAAGTGYDSGPNLMAGHSTAQLQRLFAGQPVAGGAGVPSSGSVNADGGPSSFFGGAMSNEMLRGMLHQVALSDAVSGVASVPANVIHQFREDLLQATQRPIERLTIDVVAMMFDHILADERLLPAIKALLGRLQIPVLRVALADASLFSSRQHPTRRLINRIAAYSAGFDSAEDANFQRFVQAVSQSVERVIASDAEDSDIFGTELRVLEDEIARITADSERAQSEAVNALERAELRTVMRSSIAHHIATTLAAVEVEEYLREFMRNQWALVLVECILQHGEDADETRNLKQAASDLVWSVQPKVTPHDRQHLVKILPPLVKNVREGLKLIDWPAADQQKFFAQLMASHARCVKAEAMPAQSAAASAQSSAWQQQIASAWGGTLELNSPTVIGDVVVNANEKDVAALIDTADVTAQAAAQRKPISSANLVRVDQLAVGTWYEMMLRGDWIRVQLFWRSPKGLFFMFSSNVGGKAHSITRRALDKLINEGGFRAYEAEGLIDRAVAGVMASAQGPQQAAAAAPLH
ncbi:MAG: DUF1631 family protein [Betaproteobacteria bacterium]|nr:DUF1631 family protein [Betaproteobacteria bacterium]